MKKNTFRLLGIIVIVAVIGFSMTGCPEDGGGGGPVDFGEELELSGQVYNIVSFSMPEFTKFEGNLTLGGIGTGKIEGGKLTYKAGVPGTLYPISEVIQQLEDEGFTNVNISDTSVQGGSFEYIAITGSSTYSSVQKMNASMKLSGNTFSSNSEFVVFMYCDKDVTITAAGGVRAVNEDGFALTVTLKNVNLLLKAGWNALCTQRSGKADVNTRTGTGTISLSKDNPDIMWVLH